MAPTAPMARAVRWGVLGAARIAVRHVLPALRGSAGSSIHAIASRSAETAQQLARSFEIPHAYPSYAQLLADPQIDAVYIPLPNDLHALWTIRALEAGKHVLCEKPLAMNLEQARSIQAAAQRSGCLVAEGYMIRFHPQWHRVRQLIQAGELGEVRAIQSYFAYDNPPGDNLRNLVGHGGGALYDIGGYAIVAARYVFAADPQRAIAALHREPAHGVDRLASALVCFGGGRQLSLVCATMLPRAQSLVIHGSRARLTVETPFNPARERACRLLLDDGRDLDGGGLRVERIAPADQYQLQCEAFARAVLDGGGYRYGIEDAMVNVGTTEALFRSEQSGCWEPLS